MEFDPIYLMSGLYIFAGTMHFLKPKAYMRIMPKYLPFHLELVYLSGAFEVILGIMLLFGQLQSVAAWGIIGLLLAVFPANIYMLTSNKSKKLWYKIALWVRLPLQFALIYWAYSFI